MSQSLSTETRKPSRTAITVAAAAALASLTLGPALPAAHADPAPVVEPAPPIDPAVPSSPAAVTTFPDGLTLTLGASQESQVPIPSLNPADTTSHDVIVSGTFVGDIRQNGSPRSSSGTLEVGYQIGCAPAPGMIPTMLASLKPGLSSVVVTTNEFTGSAPKVEVANYQVHIDQCTGVAFFRSYAILTRASGATNSVVAYYGVTKVI